MPILWSTNAPAGVAATTQGRLYEREAASTAAGPHIPLGVSQNDAPVQEPGQAECGGISQTFKTKKGRKYCVTFRLAGDPLHGNPAEKKLQISTAGMSAEFGFDMTGKSRLDLGWVSKCWEFTADSDQTTLEFAGLTESIFGVALDDVVVLAVP